MARKGKKRKRAKPIGPTEAAVRQPSSEARTGRIQRDGCSIAYDDVGTGRAVVFLHGFLFSRRMWSQQIERLKETHRVVTIDFRGHGGSSDVTRSCTLYDLVSDVLAVLDDCDIQRAVWVGTSMGGMVAMRAAIVAPEAVDALVLLDTDAGTEETMAKLRYRAMSFGSRIVGIRPFIPIMASIAFGATTRREHPEIVRPWKEHFAQLDPPSIRNVLEAVIRRDSVLPMLHEVDVPALVMVGEEDETFPPHRARAIAQGIDGARLEVIPRAGHMTSLEKPERFNELLLEFLRSSREETRPAELVEDPAPPPAPEETAAPTAAEPLTEPDLQPVDDDGRARLLPSRPPAEEESLTDESSASIEVDEPADVGEPTEIDERAEIVESEPETGPAAPADQMPEAPPATRDEFQPYSPEAEGAGEPKEFVRPGGKTGRERRGKRRVAPSRKLYGRVGHIGILLVDVSESGARLEHYDRRFQTGSTITIEIEWETRTLRAECQVMSSRVHRFIPGDKGSTVYQSGVLFLRMNDESKEVLRELVGRLVTRGLAEQVANARGIGPVLQTDMPTFRSGVVDIASRGKAAGSEGPVRLIKENPLMGQTGFIRCRKLGVRWERKWTLDPQQPREGFTVLGSENKLEIDMLCETWDNGDEEAKKFIRDCARMSIRTALGLSEDDQSV